MTKFKTSTHTDHPHGSQYHKNSYNDWRVCACGSTTFTYKIHENYAPGWRYIHRRCLTCGNCFNYPEREPFKNQFNIWGVRLRPPNPDEIEAEEKIRQKLEEIERAKADMKAKRIKEKRKRYHNKLIETGRIEEHRKKDVQNQIERRNRNRKLFPEEFYRKQRDKYRRKLARMTEEEKNAFYEKRRIRSREYRKYNYVKISELPLEEQAKRRAQTRAAQQRYLAKIKAERDKNNELESQRLSKRDQSQETSE